MMHSIQTNKNGDDTLESPKSVKGGKGSVNGSPTRRSPEKARPYHAPHLNKPVL